MKLLGSTENKVNKNKDNNKIIIMIIMILIIIVHCNIVKNDYQQDSSVLYKFVPKKLFGCLLQISLKKYQKNISF